MGCSYCYSELSSQLVKKESTAIAFYDDCELTHLLYVLNALPSSASKIYPTAVHASLLY